MGAIPLAEVIRRGRPPAALLLLFGFEAVLLLATGAIRIVAHRRATSKSGHYAPIGAVSDHRANAADTLKALGDGNTYLRGFLTTTAVFTLAHGLFVLLLVFVFVTQLGLILGIPVAGVTGSPWGIVGTFVALRALADASIAWLYGLTRQRDLPPGLARFLARRGRQPVDELEAEFDALKERGHDVEALLERTIDEVRGT